MNKVGMYFAYWSREWLADFSALTARASSLGFDVIEISLARLYDLPKPRLDELKKTALEYGIELIFCIGLPPDKDVASDDAAVRNTGIEYVKNLLEMVHFFEAKYFTGLNFCVWPAKPPVSMISKRPYLERSMDSVRKVIKTAEDYGIIYAIEVVNRFEQFLVNTADEAVSFCKEVGSPNIKVHLDTYHMNIEEDSFERAILQTGDFLGHMHVGESNRKMPGNGHLPWDEIFRALKKINYAGPIVMEPFVKPGGQVGSDIALWRDLSDNATEEEMDRKAGIALNFVRGKLK